MTRHEAFGTIEDLPAALPLFPLGEALLLPRTSLPLNIFEPRYLKMIDDALATERLIGMILPRRPGTDDLFPTGCAGRITAFSETGEGRYLITLTGICRFRLVREVETATPYRKAVIDWTPYADDLHPDPRADEVDREGLLTALKHYLDRNDLEADWDSVNAAPTEGLVNALATIAPVETVEKQALLEAMSVAERAEILVALIEMALAESDEPHDHTIQ